MTSLAVFHLVYALSPIFGIPAGIQSGVQSGVQSGDDSDTRASPRSGPEADEFAPGIRIERADPGPAAEARRRLAEWRELYRRRLAGLREEAEALFAALEASSLAASSGRCERLARATAAVDRRELYPSSDVRLDRVLFGSLERFRAGAAECRAGRYLRAFRLLREAWSGVEWIDRRLEARTREPIPLPGLRDPPQ